MKKAFVYLALLIGLGGLFFFFFNSKKPAKTYQIVLSEKGFTPKEITIRQGDTVRFKTTRGKPFWPASNLHPSHLLYSEFDPKEPVEPDSSWSFRFDKKGVWGFHDHLFPYYRGKITVQ